jgi:hypothetical protein
MPKRLQNLYASVRSHTRDTAGEVGIDLAAMPQNRKKLRSADTKCLACTEPSSVACRRTRVVMSPTASAAKSKWSRGYFSTRKRSTNINMLRSEASTRPRSSRRYRRYFSSDISRAVGVASTLRGVTPCSRSRSSTRTNVHIFRTYSLPALQVASIKLDDVLIELLRGEMLLHKPAVEMPDQPKLNPAVDPRIAVGCQPGCEQIDVSRQRSLS